MTIDNTEDSGPATDKAEQDYEIPELGLKPASILNDQCKVSMQIIIIYLGTFPSLYIIIVLVYQIGDRL